MKIRTEQTYKKMKAQCEQQKQFLEEERKRLEAEGWSKEKIRIALCVAEDLYHSTKSAIEEYERIAAGDFNKESCTLDEIGEQLVRLRIWKGISQTELARRLGVTHAQVNKDERNAYAGASVEKISAVLKALSVTNLVITPNREAQMAYQEMVAGEDEVSASKQAG